MAELLYGKAHMSQGDVDTLLEVCGRSGGNVPFSNHNDLYAAIDSLAVVDVPWECFTVHYDCGVVDDDDIPISQPKSWTLGPYRAFDKDGARQYVHMMSGDWAWDQADEMARDPKAHGSMFIPIILGSDKTTVSVATGQTDYYPLYLSIGNLHNNVRRSHRGGVALTGFLAIAKTEKEHSNGIEFRRFRRQLFHTSLARILSSLQPEMSEPEVAQCADGLHRRVIFGLGLYIADYPEQVLVAGVVQGWCPKCMSHKDDLETPGVPRSKEHTDIIREKFGLGDLWSLSIWSCG